MTEEEKAAVVCLETEGSSPHVIAGKQKIRILSKSVKQINIALANS